MQARQDCVVLHQFMRVLALQVDDLRGSPMSVGNLEEIIDEKSVACCRAIVPDVPHAPQALILTCILPAVTPLCHPQWDQSTMSAYFPSLIRLS